MKIIFPLLVVTLIVAGCKKQSIRGEGAILTETRNVAAFTKVRLEGGGSATIVQGNTQEVKLNGYQNLLPIYETNVFNGTLVLKFSDDYTVRNSNINVHITIPSLQSMHINGSGKMFLGNFYDTDLEAEINGTGEISTGTGSFDNAVYRINGSGKIEARNITAENVEAHISGSGTIEVTALTELLARISGSGNIYYWGNPTNIITEISGSGRIVKR